MPITVVTPQPSEPFGPGFRLQASTDLVGPLAPGSFWQIALLDSDAFYSHGDRIHPYTTTTLNIDFWGGTQNVLNPGLVVPSLVTGQPGILRVIIQEPGFGVADTTDVAVVIDRETGQVQELANYIRTHPPAGGNGLSSEEHVAVMGTLANTQKSFGGSGGSIVASLADLLDHPALAFGALSSPPMTLTGDGEVPGFGAIGHVQFGLQWAAVAVPPGLGRLHGVTEETQQRLVQFTVIHQMSAGLGEGLIDVVTEHFDADWSGGIWTWQVPLPSRILYSVLPGVVIAARWWQFP